MDSRKTWTQVYGQVLMSLLETIVFSDIVQIITSYDNCAVHFCFKYDASQNTATYRYVASEWTFLVDICAFNGLSWCFETQTNISGVT